MIQVATLQRATIVMNSPKATKTTFQLWVTLPPKISRFLPYLPLPFTITQSISTTITPSVAQQQFSNLSVPTQSTSIHVPSSTTQSVTFWELPAFLCQSTIGGHQGGDACTVISFNWKTTNHWLQAGCHVWWGEIRHMTVSCSHSYILVLPKPYLLSEAA